MENSLEKPKPVCIAISYDFPTIGKSFICYLLQNTSNGIRYQMTRISMVINVSKISRDVYIVSSKKRVFYVQVFD